MVYSFYKCSLILGAHCPCSPSRLQTLTPGDETLYHSSLCPLRMYVTLQAHLALMMLATQRTNLPLTGLALGFQMLRTETASGVPSRSPAPGALQHMVLRSTQREISSMAREPSNDPTCSQQREGCLSCRAGNERTVREAHPSPSLPSLMCVKNLSSSA